ncbi:MAG: hypothetical protein V7K50_16910 [Nostoc sp.]|uniref:hypothetical protein n=1 Tax=Nostoc sp. TaxID=1180 RepID=UPI002FFC6910
MSDIASLLIMRRSAKLPDDISVQELVFPQFWQHLTMLLLLARLHEALPLQLNQMLNSISDQEYQQYSPYLIHYRKY